MYGRLLVCQVCLCKVNCLIYMVISDSLRYFQQLHWIWSWWLIEMGHDLSLTIYTFICFIFILNVWRWHACSRALRGTILSSYSPTQKYFYLCTCTFSYFFNISFPKATQYWRTSSVLIRVFKEEENKIDVGKQRFRKKFYILKPTLIMENVHECLQYPGVCVTMESFQINHLSSPDYRLQQ